MTNTRIVDMQVKELQAKQPIDNIELEITSIAEPRTFSTPRSSGRVANAMGKDETGEVKITLWNDDIEKVKEGNHITIENGYTSEYKGELQVSTGRFGKLTVKE